MKRNKNLETLSWEHHDGLVVAFRLEKGIKNQADDQTMVRYLLHTWDHDLQQHFLKEEQTLIKPLDASDAGREALQQMLQEHETFRKLIARIRSRHENPLPMIKQFYQMLHNHIRFEERNLFPIVERITPQKELQKIGWYLHSHHQPDKKDWQPEFWR
jgi:iron-sulfur cluster repair protein YtfE (RIC family)